MSASTERKNRQTARSEGSYAKDINAQKEAAKKKKQKIRWIIVGVAIVGRPVSRYLDDGLTLEVNRLCTNGTKNACSFLYGAAARAAKVMGYRKIITYILDTESGTSLRASGWQCAGLAGGREWTGKRRPPEPLYPAQMKYRYEKILSPKGVW